MGQQDKEAAARSYGRECKRQAADLEVSNRLVGKAGVRQTLPSQAVPEWKACMPLEHMP